MFLVVDIGNSHTVTGMFDGDKLIGQWRLKSDIKNTADELAIHYHNLFAMASIPKEKISGVVIASVVPTLQSAWVNCCKQHFTGCPEDKIFVVTYDKINSLITVLLENKKEVGADRLVNGLAAWSLFQGNQVVLDFGTAITFDCITLNCEYLGGTILPGIAISLEALANKTAKLPHISVSDPPSTVIGKSTVHAMKSGILYGYGGMIDGLVQRIKNEMLDDENDDFRVVATGGMAGLIAPYTNSIDDIQPMLTIKGLEIIYRKLVA